MNYVTLKRVYEKNTRPTSSRKHLTQFFAGQVVAPEVINEVIFRPRCTQHVDLALATMLNTLTRAKHIATHTRYAHEVQLQLTRVLNHWISGVHLHGTFRIK